MTFTTDKHAVIECYGANGTYNVRVRKGTTLKVLKHLSQPVLLEERKISKTAYDKYYAPPKVQTPKDDKEEN